MILYIYETEVKEYRIPIRVYVGANQLDTLRKTKVLVEGFMFRLTLIISRK